MRFARSIETRLEGEASEHRRADEHKRLMLKIVERGVGADGTEQIYVRALEVVGHDERSSRATDREQRRKLSDAHRRLQRSSTLHDDVRWLASDDRRHNDAVLLGSAIANDVIIVVVDAVGKNTLIKENSFFFLKKSKKQKTKITHRRAYLMSGT
jgi:hypothetical protein